MVFFVEIELLFAILLAVLGFLIGRYNYYEKQEVYFFIKTSLIFVATTSLILTQNYAESIVIFLVGLVAYKLRILASYFAVHLIIAFYYPDIVDFVLLNSLLIGLYIAFSKPKSL